MPDNIKTRPATLWQRPIVGVLIWPSRIWSLMKGKPSPSMELAAEAAKEADVVLYFFNLRDVYIGKKRIYGWQKDADGKWVYGSMPWPDVFLPAMEIQLPKWQKVRRALFRYTRPINSYDVLDKWKVHLALSTFPEMQAYLPKTMLYTTKYDLKMMLHRHSSILAKPCRGSGAMNISRIWRVGKTHYGWQDSSTGNKVTGLSFASLLRRVINNAKGSFVLQEELPILEADRKRNKVRVLLNKDGSGEWCHTLNYAFIGKAGQFAVSRHQGAKQMSLCEGLTIMGFSDEEKNRITRKLIMVSMMTVKCLDQAMGPMGEIGLDLAIGESGRVWLIEANARPNKDNLPFTSRKKLLRPFQMMMQYAHYLALQPSRQGGRR